jgi:hypothetical protein|tara:strand:- start:92 stop:1072 length:981 start_codon:yes stop_codon:yes gene_type:complete
MDLNKDILWVFSHSNPPSIPSYVFSGILPADYLNIQKVIFLKDHNPREMLTRFNPKLIIINKAMHINVINLAKTAKELNIKIISVFDDWYFIKPESRRTQLRFVDNLKLAKYSNNIIAKTKSAANIIYKHTGFRAKIISDCVRFESQMPINKINYPFKISWFGMDTNHDTLEFGIREILEYNFEAKIKIITNKSDKIRSKLSNLNLKNISLEFIKWSKSMDKEVVTTDIVIIPYLNDHKRLVKSYNRITDSINLGRFAIISDLNHLREFNNFCFLGNIGKGLKWSKENNLLAVEKVKKGFEYVKKNYSVATIASEWKNIIYQNLKK